MWCKLVSWKSRSLLSLWYSFIYLLNIIIIIIWKSMYISCMLKMLDEKNAMINVQSSASRVMNIYFNLQSVSNNNIQSYWYQVAWLK